MLVALPPSRTGPLARCSVNYAVPFPSLCGLNAGTSANWPEFEDPRHALSERARSLPGTYVGVTDYEKRETGSVPSHAAVISHFPEQIELHYACEKTHG